MDITSYGHSCVLLSYPATDSASAVQVLIDPGVFSSPACARLENLDALVITHQHPDHAYPPYVAALLEAHPSAQILVEPQTAAILKKTTECAAHAARFRECGAGSEVRVGRLLLQMAGGAHATIHPDIPPVGNVSVIVRADNEPTVAHTGDSLVPHPELTDADAVLWPLVAPWSKMQETIDFLRTVRPRIAIGVHDRVASPEGRAIYLKQATAYAPEGTEVRDFERDGHAVTFPGGDGADAGRRLSL